MTNAIPTNPSAITLMETRIRDAVKARLDEVVSEEVKKAQDRVASRVPEIVAGMSLSMMKMVNMSMLGEDLRITVQMPERKS